MKILFVCTGNSCRSQMAEGILKSLRPDLDVFSAGVKPEKEISSYAIEVMKEIGFDISGHNPKDIKIFEGKEFDYLITFSETARVYCEKFSDKVNNILHFEVDDPFNFKGTSDEILNEYRKIREIIRTHIKGIF